MTIQNLIEFCKDIQQEHINTIISSFFLQQTLKCNITLSYLLHIKKNNQITQITSLINQHNKSEYEVKLLAYNSYLLNILHFRDYPNTETNLSTYK
jgi:hypothetical protein